MVAERGPFSHPPKLMSRRKRLQRLLDDKNIEKVFREVGHFDSLDARARSFYMYVARYLYSVNQLHRFLTMQHEDYDCLVFTETKWSYSSPTLHWTPWQIWKIAEMWCKFFVFVREGLADIKKKAFAVKNLFSLLSLRYDPRDLQYDFPRKHQQLLEHLDQLLDLHQEFWLLCQTVPDSWSMYDPCVHDHFDPSLPFPACSHLFQDTHINSIHYVRVLCSDARVRVAECLDFFNQFTFQIQDPASPVYDNIVRTFAVEVCESSDDRKNPYAEAASATYEYVTFTKGIDTVEAIVFGCGKYKTIWPLFQYLHGLIIAVVSAPKARKEIKLTLRNLPVPGDLASAFGTKQVVHMVPSRPSQSKRLKSVPEE